MQTFRVLMIACALFGHLAVQVARADNVVVGVNSWYSPPDVSPDTMVRQLAENGVKTLRISLFANSVEFVVKAYQHGIGSVIIVYPHTGSTTKPKRGWADVPLSELKPEQFTEGFKPMLDKLEASGVRLTAIELGNEINTSGMNGDIAVPGSGRALGLADLDNPNDPEGRAIAAGYRVYIQIAAALKELRDHSRLNQHTPIVAAGMANWGRPGPKAWDGLLGVSLVDSIEFLQQNGLDEYVDGYGVHVYPGLDPSRSVATRIASLGPDVFGACTRARPCWLTEWGIPDGSSEVPDHCPIDETKRIKAIEELRGALQHFADEGRLTAIIFYDWADKPGNKGAIFRCGALTAAGKLAISPLSPAMAQTADAKDTPQSAALCVECLKIRVGLPRVMRGPPGDTVDNTFNEIRLPSGRFRGFTAVGSSYAIDGDTPWDMGGPAVTVLKPGPSGSPSSCGQWLMHVEPAGTRLLGWVHNETACRYTKNGNTHMSLTLATSADNGLTWSVLGPIITGTDQPTPGKETGETCFSTVDGKDGYYYAYCARNRDQLNYVARAPVASPGPGNWKKYFNGAWSEPGVRGDASKPGIRGVAAFWLDIRETVGFVYAPRARAPGDIAPAPGGMHIAFSKDHLNFTVLPEPLLLLDGGGWDRPNPYELLDYWSLLDGQAGGNQLHGNQWNLFYMDLQPNEGFSKRYLVFRPLEISRSRQADEPQVGVLLGHWHNARLQEHWSTIAAVPGSYADFKLEAQSGYLMTVVDAKRPSVELEDCVMTRGQHRDHVLSPSGLCEGRGYQRQRSVGWVYSTPQPGAQPLYSCNSESEQSHFAANREDCDGSGKMETLLGYDLKE
jgi:hypothetical protein